jgi:benzodiazapine receptor
MQTTKMISIIVLVLCILLCYSAAGIGSMFTISAIPGWYRTLNKPTFNPPNWIFGPVWSVLYLMMAVALWLVWQKIGWNWKHPAYYIFLIQLVLNALWSVIFFSWHRLDWAMLDIILLWSSILATMLTFWTVNPVAGALLIPYLCWVSFASVLNYAIWKLNS